MEGNLEDDITDSAAALRDCQEPRKLHSVEIKSKRILILKTNKKQSDANW